MFKNLVRAGTSLLAAILAVSAASVTAQVQPPLKVAFVYVSPIGEAGWSFQHDLGRREMEKALGDRVRTTVVESVAEGSDSERVLRDLARQGNQLVFATSFGYLEPALRVAAEFPGVRFEHAGGYKTAANLKTYDARYYEARYLAGLLAGATSRSGVAGYVAGFPVPEVIQGLNAFTLGMREANPKAVVKVVWLNSWFDPAREADAAQALVNQGADVLTNHSASPAVAQTAQSNFAIRGVRFIGYQSDMHGFAPDAQLGAVVHHWGSYYSAEARAVLEGQWTSRPVWGAMRDGFVELAALDPRLPVTVLRRVEGRRKAIVAGTFKPFSAPLRDNRGNVRLSQGTLDEPAIQTMNWLVEGVAGSLPGT